MKLIDTLRYQELLAKRERVGLSDVEADELGRMFARIQDQPYSNAEMIRTAAREERERAFRGFRRLLMRESVRPAA